MVFLGLTFGGAFPLYSVVAALIYIPQNSVSRGCRTDGLVSLLAVS